MKYFIFAIMLSSIAMAENPDGRASLALMANGGILSGDYTSTSSSGGSADREGSVKSFALSLALVAPTSENVSLLGSISYVAGKMDTHRPSFSADYETKGQGILFTVGIKYYITK